MRQKRQSFIPVFSLILAAASCSGPQGPSKAEVSDLQANIDKVPPPFVAKDPLSQNHWEATRQVYTLRQFQPVLSSADVVLQTLQNASADGLNPEDFDVAGLQTLRDSLKSSPDSAKENELDLHLTYSLVRYVSQLCFGRIDPRMINPEWPETGRNCDVDQIVFDALQKTPLKISRSNYRLGFPNIKV